jgi:diguanylate cyclase (GGDEF)-like protein
LEQPHPRLPIVVLTGLIAALTVVAVGLFLIYREYNSAYYRTEQANLTSARLVAQGLVRMIRTSDVGLNDILENLREPGSASADHALRAAQSLVHQFPEVSFVLLEDRLGNLVWTTASSEVPAINYADRPYFQQHRAGIEFAVGAPIVSRSTGRLILPVTRAIRDANGKFAGVVLAAIEISAVNSLLAASLHDSSYTAALNGLDGTVLARIPTVDIGTRFTNLAVLRRLQTAPFGTFEGLSVVANKTPRLFGYATVEGYPLVVTTSREKRALVADWASFAMPFGSVILTLAAGLVLLTLREWRVMDKLIQTQGALCLSEDMLSKAQAIAHIGSWHLDMRTGAMTWSNETYRIFGVPAGDCISFEVFVSHVHPQDRPAFDAAWEGALREGSFDFEHRIVVGDQLRWVRERSEINRDASGAAAVSIGSVEDITALKQHQQQLDHIAHHDPLTGLPNRILLADRLQQGIAQSQRRGKSLAVVYLDLDGFKPINDRYGHDVGDEFLIALAHRMKAALREGDTLARIGGDEFVAVLADLERRQDCDFVLARLLLAASDPLTVRAQVLQVSASIGVSLYPQDGADADLLLRYADQAMYEAKQAGKNRYHMFDVEHDLAVRTQREGVERIRDGLNRREFVLHYQPKVNMNTGEVIGAEALIRWEHPERGLLPPATFLPFVEDHPANAELGNWVIDTALTQVARWRAAGLDLPVSVNVGARHLQQADFVQSLRELLAAHPEVQPSLLELEILETSALEDIGMVTEIIQACREMGVRFALDDFGTGYSSLTYLKRLPADLLKIDKSFIRDMLDGPDDLAIVKGIVGLAQAFHRDVIAEGVETVAHGELLLSLGCQMGQGYAIARPMPGSELPGWAATWRPDAAWTAGRTPSRRRRSAAGLRARELSLASTETFCATS